MVAVAAPVDPECCHVEIGLSESGIAGFDTTNSTYLSDCCQRTLSVLMRVRGFFAIDYLISLWLYI